MRRLILLALILALISGCGFVVGTAMNLGMSEANYQYALECSKRPTLEKALVNHASDMAPEVEGTEVVTELNGKYRFSPFQYSCKTFDVNVVLVDRGEDIEIKYTATDRRAVAFEGVFYNPPQTYRTVNSFKPKKVSEES